ncbi:PAS domain-containing protein [Bradyrhizobium sp. F1.2.2]
MSPSHDTHPRDDARGEHFRVRIEGFGVGTWDLDLNTRELDWSETAGALLGVAQGQPRSYDLFMSRLERGDRERVERAFKRVCERGGGFDLSFRVAGESESGQSVRARAGVIRDEAGAARHLSGIFLDIDEEKQVEQAVRSRETHLRSILHTIPDAMIVIDGNSIIQLFQHGDGAAVRLVRARGDRPERQHFDAGARRRPP